MEIEPFVYYFVFTNTLDLSNNKWNLAQLDQYPPIKIYQILYGTTISILYNMGDFLVILNISGSKAIFILFCVRQDTESSSLTGLRPSMECSNIICGGVQYQSSNQKTVMLRHYVILSYHLGYYPSSRLPSSAYTSPPYLNQIPACSHHCRSTVETILRFSVTMISKKIRVAMY